MKLATTYKYRRCAECLLPVIPKQQEWATCVSCGERVHARCLVRRAVPAPAVCAGCAR